jgi:hypothetical protein
MAHNPAITLASTIQSASINRHPSPSHDLNPSTVASSKQPVRLSSPSHSRSPSNASISSSAINLKPIPRRATLPPLPDLRFEQSYLASIKDADTYGKVAYITIRDQVVLPLVQGTLWTLVLSGWRYWNRSASFSGRSIGGKIRRWWWGVNNWAIPEGKGGRGGDGKLAGEVKEVGVFLPFFWSGEGCGFLGGGRGFGVGSGG